MFLQYFKNVQEWSLKTFSCPRRFCFLLRFPHRGVEEGCAILAWGVSSLIHDHHHDGDLYHLHLFEQINHGFIMIMIMMIMIIMNHDYNHLDHGQIWLEIRREAVELFPPIHNRDLRTSSPFHQSRAKAQERAGGASLSPFSCYGSSKVVLPLLLVHGWPGSVVEFFDIIPLLVEGNAKVLGKVHKKNIPF